ncbi:MAG: multiheme c-type cytochrome, partial [Nitrospirota bacterium]
HAKSFSNWSATKHARAFSALVKTGDQYDPECVPCHVTGYGFPTGYNGKNADLRNVTCEDCHGAGGLHSEYEMPGDYLKPYSVPPVHVREKICMGCHDNYHSPNFDFKKYERMGGAHRGYNGP